MPLPQHCIDCDKVASIVTDGTYYCSNCYSKIERNKNQMTIKNHIINFLHYIEGHSPPLFKTSDIQGLSSRSRKVFGKILGSPSTYERTFRQMRTDGLIQVSKKDKRQGEKQTTWILEEIK